VIAHLEGLRHRAFHPRNDARRQGRGCRTPGRTRTRPSSTATQRFGDARRNRAANCILNERITELGPFGAQNISARRRRRPDLSPVLPGPVYVINAISTRAPRRRGSCSLNASR
jgi:hypothetical protein